MARLTAAVGSALLATALIGGADFVRADTESTPKDAQASAYASGGNPTGANHPGNGHPGSAQPAHFGRHGWLPSGSPSISLWYGSPALPYAYTGYPYGAYRYSPYAYVPGYYSDYPYLGPLYVPAEQFYGPQALARFLGAGPSLPPSSSTNANVAPDAGNPPVIGGRDPAPERGTNAQSVALCRRCLAVGDTYFGNQKYVSAYLRYTQGTSAAPRQADAYLRQGISLIVLGRYEQAARALKRSVELDAKLDQMAFRLDDIYGPNRMAKGAHLDALAKAATDQPANSDLLFLLGIFLHFDGQTDRAKPFFQRAAQLAGEERAHLQAFLN